DMSAPSGSALWAKGIDAGHDDSIRRSTDVSHRGIPASRKRVASTPPRANIGSGSFVWRSLKVSEMSKQEDNKAIVGRWFADAADGYVAALNGQNSAGKRGADLQAKAAGGVLRSMLARGYKPQVAQLLRRMRLLLARDLGGGASLQV